MQNEMQLVSLKLGRPQSLASSPGLTSAAIPPLALNDDQRSDTADYVLPPRKKADSLMAAYWQHAHVLYPYLDRTRTEAYDKSVWQDSSTIPGEMSFLCLLNIMFALSSQILEATMPQARERLANTFYSRAWDLLDIPAPASVRSVQTFLLLGLYFQGRYEPHSCWMFIGMGIRTGMALGLHLSGTSEQVASPGTRELLRRVWHGCVLWTGS